MISNNIIGSAQKNISDIEAKVALQDFSQESSVPLIFTGRRELNGFKGYHNYRRGYVKYKDNWWYPKAAFVVSSYSNTKPASLKAVSDVKKANLTHSVEKSKPWMIKEHVESCRARYRSYNVNDNSYQPFHGHRKQCLSHFFKR
ncbi:hypothetical protein ABID23_000154 [Bartonella silvatica]|uniref:Lectin-like protein BA14k n=2 Tax=Bartonella silvatica TaxID=357760 RepID=A0ABV2HEX4_9HYPH